jgi:hypothetical protein
MTARAIPKRPVMSVGFWIRFLSGTVATVLGGAVIGLGIAGFSPVWGQGFITASLLGALIFGWECGRSLPKTVVEQWRRDHPEPPPPPPVQRYYFREGGYTYGPHTLEELLVRFPAPAGIEVTEDCGQSERELRRAEWKRLSDLVSQATVT